MSISRTRDRACRGGPRGGRYAARFIPPPNGHQEYSVAPARGCPPRNSRDAAPKPRGDPSPPYRLCTATPSSQVPPSCPARSRADASRRRRVTRPAQVCRPLPPKSTCCARPSLESARGRAKVIERSLPTEDGRSPLPPPLDSQRARRREQTHANVRNRELFERTRSQSRYFYWQGSLAGTAKGWVNLRVDGCTSPAGPSLTSSRYIIVWSHCRHHPRASSPGGGRTNSRPHNRAQRSRGAPRSRSARGNMVGVKPRLWPTYGRRHAVRRASRTRLDELTTGRSRPPLIRAPINQCARAVGHRAVRSEYATSGH